MTVGNENRLSVVSRRNLLLAVGALAFTRPLHAQQPRKTFKVGLLGAESAAEWTRRANGVRAGLKDLGYVEGKHLFLESRWADGRYDRLPELATELIRQQVDVLVVFGTKAAVGAKRATTEIPIVMASAGDVVALGLVANLARPGGNITGSINVGRELGAKRLGLLKDALPGVTSVAYLVNPANPAFGPNLQAIWDAARSLKISARPFEIREPKEIEPAFARLAKEGIEGIVLQDETMFAAQSKSLAQLAIKHRIPAIGSRAFPDEGGLLGYGPDYGAMDRRAAYFVDKILKGAKPADLPIE